MKINLNKIKLASLRIASINEDKRNDFLICLAEVLRKRKDEVLKANKIDIDKAIKSSLKKSFIERLIFSEKDYLKMLERINKIKTFKSGIDRVISEKKLDDGLVLKKVKVPLGVIFVIYEARPEVTIDVACLCIKSGNSVILKGGSEALFTNLALFRGIQYALEKSGLEKDVVHFISTNERMVIKSLLKRNDLIDLVVARGGYGLAKYVYQHSKIPVLAHSAGGARIYIDKSADLLMAEKIILNAKTSKPAACNSLDTVVIHQNIATEFVSKITSRLEGSGIKIVENCWDREFLGLSVSIKVVKNVEKAVDFINQHTKRHSEGIIATDKKVIDYFTKSIDSAALFINCSTRLHDGYMFGMGAELGISTGKLHARGPVGLKELTTYKWEVYGNGQIRK